MVQFDLLDVTHIERANDGIGYLANFIDVYSRYAWLEPLKNKSDLRGKINSVLKRIRDTNPENVDKVYQLRVQLGWQEPDTKNQTPYPEAIYSDKEAVAEAHDFKDIVANHGIEWVTITPGEKTALAMVERFNLTLRQLIAKYNLDNDTNRYIDDLKRLVNHYNHTQNSNLSYKTPYSIYFW